MTPKGYWIAFVDVSDPAAYENYRAANGVAFSKYGAQFLVRGGAKTQKEGISPARAVVIAFKDYATALACYDSPEYQAAKALRDGASVGEVVVVEGYVGAQPE